MRLHWPGLCMESKRVQVARLPQVARQIQAAVASAAFLRRAHGLILHRTTLIDE
jgi:hypothetical protein